MESSNTCEKEIAICKRGNVENTLLFLSAARRRRILDSQRWLAEKLVKAGKIAQVNYSMSSSMVCCRKTQG